MVAALSLEHVYPVVRRFIVAADLPKTLKGFDKDTAEAEEGEASGKKAKKLAKMELATACGSWLEAHKGLADVSLKQSEVYPALRKFFEDNELAKSLKAFDKEAPADEAPPSGKKAKALAKLDLVAACSEHLAAQLGGADAVEAEAAPEKTKKRKMSEEASKEEPAQDEPPAKKKKASKEERANKQPGQAFSRVDNEAWRAKITDPRLLDNTHLSKAKFGGSAGDSWADKASEDMLKVKGKGFRKEMAKKKRASWTGGGELDQGVNSIKFPDSDDE